MTFGLSYEAVLTACYFVITLLAENLEGRRPAKVLNAVVS